MHAELEELVGICDALPPEKRDEVTEFARFLLSRKNDAAWERTLSNPAGYPKLGAFVTEAMTEESEPLDIMIRCTPKRCS